MDTRHLSCIAMGLTSFEGIPQLVYRTDYLSATFHGNALTSVRGLEKLTALTHLNLSSNKITCLKGVQALSSLGSLDIGYNLLESIDGLQVLTELTRLNIAHNHVTSLSTLTPACGLAQSLAVIDLQGNLLSSMQVSS